LKFRSNAAQKKTMARAVIGALVLATVLAACGGGGDKKKAASTTTTTVAITTTTVAPPTAPLTGLPDPAGQSLTRPALAVKIENTPDARPQAGIDQADVVYEEVVEGDITRFVTIFNSNVPDTVGPVRSVRAEDPDILWPIGGIFAFSGGAPVNVEAINAAPVNAVDETSAGNAMERNAPGQPSRNAPHNLYGHPAALFALGGKPVPPPPLFQYLAPAGVVSGQGVLAMHVGFQAGYDPTWNWDASGKTWKRSIDGGPSTVVGGAQLATTNVVVQFTPYTGEAEGQTVGEGDVWVFTDGVVRVGKWVRPDKTQPAKYVDAAGTAILLRPGHTWVELLPVGNTVDVTPAPAPPPTTAAPTTTTVKKATKK
jgi:Protein of unknown function (DUF3048) N-terminal domain/Protein of unknown function (DUF3048) C-terminal domain